MESLVCFYSVGWNVLWLIYSFILLWEQLEAVNNLQKLLPLWLQRRKYKALWWSWVFLLCYLYFKLAYHLGEINLCRLVLVDCWLSNQIVCKWMWTCVCAGSSSSYEAGGLRALRPRFVSLWFYSSSKHVPLSLHCNSTLLIGAYEHALLLHLAFNVPFSIVNRVQNEHFPSSNCKKNSVTRQLLYMLI